MGASTLGARPTFGALLLKAALCSTVVTVSVGCATLPIGLWPFASRRQDGTRPWLFYLVAGLGSVFLGGVGTFSALYLETFDPVSSWIQFREKASWLILAFAITFSTAYQMHSRPSPSWSLRRLRAAHAIAQAAVLSLACVLVYYDLLAQHLLDKAQAVLPLVPTMAVSGALIGSLVPAWFSEPVPDSTPSTVAASIVDLTG